MAMKRLFDEHTIRKVSELYKCFASEKNRGKYNGENNFK